MEVRRVKHGENPVRWRTLLFRLVVTVVVLAIWFWTQSLLGARTPPAAGGIGDALHNLTASWNSYLAQDTTAANALLIVSSACIDALGVFLLGSWLFGGSVRPFLGLVLLMLLRQFLQALRSLPVPTGMIWHDPGFPSLLVTYMSPTTFSSPVTLPSRFSAQSNSPAFAGDGSLSAPSYWSCLRLAPS